MATTKTKTKTKPTPKVKKTVTKKAVVKKPSDKPKVAKPRKRKALKPVRIAFVLDRSGSMSSMWAEAINGTNAFIKDQQDLGGDGTFTLAVFDHEYVKHYNNVDLTRVQPLGVDTIQPRGTTALFEAVSRTLEEMLEKPTAKGTLNIVAIMTDGMNNVWHEYYTQDRAKELTTTAQKKGYQVVFLAANLDVPMVAQAMGINAASASTGYAATGDGAMNALRSLSQSVTSYRIGTTKKVDLTTAATSATTKAKK